MISTILSSEEVFMILEYYIHSKRYRKLLMCTDFNEFEITKFVNW